MERGKAAAAPATRSATVIRLDDRLREHFARAAACIEVAQDEDPETRDRLIRFAKTLKLRALGKACRA